MKGLEARNGGRAGLIALVAILLLGLGLRAGEAWDGRSPVYDAAAYATIAANLERGDGFTLGDGATQPASNYSPGLPLFVGGMAQEQATQQRVIGQLGGARQIAAAVGFGLGEPQ